jgi:hypothetical protein
MILGIGQSVDHVKILLTRGISREVATYTLAYPTLPKPHRPSFLVA